MDLVIVESPTKAKTLSQFLGKGYKVLASFGHLRDLPKSQLGVDTERDFEPQYVIVPKAKPAVKLLEAEAKKADAIWLSTDPDREGEAIAWHIAQVLGAGQVQSSKSTVQSRKKGVNESPNNEPQTSNFKRVVFHEITGSAVRQAFKKPRLIDLNLVNSQQARRILDRLVGYKLSPLLWKKVVRNLSAGRVQSVAVRLVVDRERERQAFVAKEYWKIVAILLSSKDGPDFEAFLVEKNGKKIEVGNRRQVDEIEKEVKVADFVVSQIKKEERKRYPAPPFTTSTLQQASGNKLGFTASRTMKAAQALYEKGLITYMRTDSLNLAAAFLSQAHSFIRQKFGEAYAPPLPIRYKTKAKLAQEAHEAIRPTNLQVTANQLPVTGGDEKKIYDLVCKRALASQMVPATFEATTIDVLASGQRPLKANQYLFRVVGSVLKFDGWLALYGVKDREAAEGEAKNLPVLSQSQKLILKEVQSSQHFTEPPGRYTEASLVKALEEHGIGRPSTYAPIIFTIQQRGYVAKDGRFLYPQDIGFVVNDLLVKHFPGIVDIGFTSDLEEKLDAVAEGKQDWVKLLRDFYTPFEKLIKEKEGEIKKEEVTRLEKIEEKCPECGRDLVVKIGKFGRFISCTGFPECKYARPVVGETVSFQKESPSGKGTPSQGEVDQSQLGQCPQDGGNLVLKNGRFGAFIACSNYPNCKFTKPYLKKVGGKCPECRQGDVVLKRTKSQKIFFGCSRYPDCKFASWKKPTLEKSQN